MPFETRPPFGNGLMMNEITSVESCHFVRFLRFIYMELKTIFYSFSFCCCFWMYHWMCEFHMIYDQSVFGFIRLRAIQVLCLSRWTKPFVARELLFSTRVIWRKKQFRMNLPEKGFRKSKTIIQYMTHMNKLSRKNQSHSLDLSWHLLRHWYLPLYHVHCIGTYWTKITIKCVDSSAICMQIEQTREREREMLSIIK